MVRVRPRTTGRAIVVLLLAIAASETDAQIRSPIVFPTSGSPEAQALFVKGVTSLHNFEYEEALEAFRTAQQRDPSFAMAYWGEAMTYHQTLWRNENVDEGRRALAKLAPTPAARAAKAKTPRERAWLAAVDVLFGDGDVVARKKAYATALGAIYAGAPDDAEAASFYALALLGTMSRSLIGYVDSHEGYSDMLAGSEVQRRAGEILGRVLRAHPDHPGALHYLIHAYDDPEHAHLALDAARAYSKVAAKSSHALHMPAHIFFQLGLWHDAVLADRIAYDTSDAWCRDKNLPPTLRSYHSLSWLHYELLQLGRYREAKATMAELEPVVKSSGLLNLLSNLATMRARYVVETEQWALMGQERNFANINELYAIGVSAARTGNTALAELARQTLGQRAQAPEEGDLRPAAAIMERQVAGMMSLAAGRRDEAVATLRAAADTELALPPPLGLPVPITPAPELLGDVLIEVGRPREALDAFTKALARNANRTRSVLGMARASAAVGDTAGARTHYQQLLANYDHADADVPEAREARDFIAGRGAGGWWAAVAVSIALAGVVVAAVVVWSRRATPPLSRAERRRRER
ncbi:MAG: hypothetical protein U0Q12_05635 [Vicinamibacterales bacterium]